MTRIARAELLELTLPLLEPFIISGGTMTERRSLIVVLHDDAGHVGYGECPAFERPFYSEETLSSARDLITRVLLPWCARGCVAIGSPARGSKQRHGISKRTRAARVSRCCSASDWP